MSKPKDKDPKKQVKGGVKFAEEKMNEKSESPATVETKIRHYMNAEDCRNLAIQTFNETDRLQQLYTKTDYLIKRKDTAKALLSVLDQLKDTLEQMNVGTAKDKEENFYLVYNGTIYIYEICQLLRKSFYASVAKDYIAYCILCLESNIVLYGVKYLDWRIKLYIELCHIYEDCNSLSAASRTIETAIKKIQELKEIEEQDPPVPDHTNKILQLNLKNLKILEVKFKLQTGALTPDAWRKKIEEYFSQDKQARTLAIIESLRVSAKKNTNIIENEGKKLPWKEPSVVLAYDMLKNEIETIAKALIQIQEKIQRTLEFNNKKDMLDENQRIEEVKKNRDLDSQMIKEKEWKQASVNVPFEAHVELLKQSFDVNKTEIFEQLAKAAETRAKYRRLEVPYITDIDIMMTQLPYPNIPNGYEKLPFDLNEAHLRNELYKLRSAVHVVDVPTEDEINKIKKQEKSGKGEIKGKNDNKVQEQQQQQQNKVNMTHEPTEEELMAIGHNYVYILVKRSPNPEGAIYKIDVVLADDETGPTEKLQEGWKSIGIPVNQYVGVRETNNQISYLCFKHSEDNLKNEEEKKSLVIDVLPLFGKNPLIRPDLGYDKINIDLRQVPKQFVRIPTNDYVYLTYKYDELFYVNERELKLLILLQSLESTYGIPKINAVEDEYKAKLNIIFDLHKIKMLIDCLRESLDGPLGEQFLDKRKDFLTSLSFFLWKKYFQTFLIQSDIIVELVNSGEIQYSEFYIYESFIKQFRKIIAEAIISFNLILTKNQFQDILWLCKLNIELCKILEEEEECRVAVQNLRFCLGKLVNYRDEKLSRGVTTKNDLFIGYSLTCNNRKLRSLIENMKKRYIDWKNQLAQLIRSKTREKFSKKQLQKDEAQEEEYETLEAFKTFMEYGNRDEKYFESLQTKRPIDEVTGFINALHTEILINLFRCELKAGESIDSQAKEKSKTLAKINEKNKNMPLWQREGIEGVADHNIKKMTILKKKTATEIKKNLAELQNTLQNAGKLDPPKPEMNQHEKNLIQQCNKNQYSNALLHVTIASNKDKFAEQRYLLKQAFNYIQEAEKEEETQLKLAIEDSVYILSTLLDDIPRNQTNQQYYPFSYLYIQDYIKPTQVPRKPIIISHNSTSVTVRLPPYNPIIQELLLLENPRIKQIKSMAVYGKVSANGVDVSLTCTALQNTGIMYPVGSIIYIPNILPNENYCFAAAAYNVDEGLINEIGETSLSVCTNLPLPINQLYSHLAKLAYQIGDYEIAEKSAERVILFFCEKSDIKEKILDFKENPLELLRLNSTKVHDYTIIEQRSAAESFVISARCKSLRYKEQETLDKKNKLVNITKQKNLMKVCNLLLLGLELAVNSRNFILVKRIILELYNKIGKLIKMKYRSKLLFQVLLKMQLIQSEIPEQLWDDQLRIVSTKISYEIVIMDLLHNEINLTKRILYDEIGISRRKWTYIPKIEMIEEEQQNNVSKDDKKKDLKKDNKAKVKQENEKQKVEEQQPVKLIPKLVRILIEKKSVQNYFEEFLMSVSEEYSDQVRKFVENSIQQIEALAPYVKNGEEIAEKVKAQLSEQIEFWELTRDMSSALNRLQANYKSSERYFEYCCRLARRLYERGSDPKLVLDALNTVQEPDTEGIKIYKKIIHLKVDAISNDIEWDPYSVQDLIKEKQMTGEGNDKAIDIFNSYFSLHDLFQDFVASDNWNKLKYELLCLSEFYLCKAVGNILINSVKQVNVVMFDIYHEIYLMDLEKVKLQIKEVNEGSSPKEMVQQQQRVSHQRIEEIELILNILSTASSYAAGSKSWIQLQNIAKYVRNIFINDMLRPFDHQNTRIWIYLSVICENLLVMLKYIKKVSGTSIQQENEDEEINRKVKFDEDRQDEEQQTALNTEINKDYWFLRDENLDILTVANVFGYTIQCLLIESKLSVLIGLSKNFSNLTNHYYSNYILPFTVYAQEVILKIASDKVKNKEEQLNKRNEDYENWKNNTKKRKTRQALLTGEIPLEQIDYERDAQELKNQINLLQMRENFCKNEKDRSHKILASLQRDANQALESLNQCQKLLEKFANDEYIFYCEEINADINSQEYKAKKKAIKVFSSTVLSKYKMTLDILRKRQEVFGQIVALHDIGNIHFTCGNLQEAEENWNDSLDTIFQNIYSLKSFRKLFQEHEFLAHVYGIKQSLIGIILLNKIVYYCCSNKQNLLREGAIMASQLGFGIFKVTLPHPFIQNAFGEYRLREIIENEQQFSKKSELDPAELAISCCNIAGILIDLEEYVKALPLLALLEYLATDILQSHYYNIKAKLLKCICLSNNGFIQEAYSQIVKVYQNKDEPLPWQRPGQYLNKEKGQNTFNQEAQFYNEFTQFDEKNKEPLDILLKMELKKDFGFKYGFINMNLFNYAKALITYNVFENEIYERYEQNEIRCLQLRNVEKQLRDTLRNLATEEEAFYQQNEIKKLKQQSDGTNKELIEKKEQKLVQYLQVAGYESNDIDKFRIHQEETLSYSEIRIERLQLMLRIRYKLARLNMQMNYYTKAFYIIKYAITNLGAYCQGQRLVENALEKENESLEISTTAKDDKGTNKKNEPKKPADPKKPQVTNANDLMGYEDNLREDIKDEVYEAILQNEQSNTRRHMSGIWWVKLRAELCELLFKQNKYNDCLEYIEIVKNDSQLLTETFYVRRVMELQAKIYQKLGQINKSIEKCEEVIIHAKSNYHDDTKYCRFLGDYAEILYERKQFDKALNIFKEALDYSQHNLRQIRYEVISANKNDKASSEKVELCSSMIISEETEQSILAPKSERIVRRGERGATKEEQKKTAAKKDEKGKTGKTTDSDIPQIKINPLYLPPHYDLIKDPQIKFIDMDSDTINNTKLKNNIYIKSLDLRVKAIIRYINCYIQINEEQINDYQQMLQLLEQAEIIMSKSLSPLINLKIELYYLNGRINKIQFYNGLKEIQNIYVNKYIQEKNKRYKKLKERLPFRDYARNKYMIETPNFTQELIENLLPLLSTAKDYFIKATTLLRSECLLLENNFNVSRIFTEIGEVSLLQREYRPRIIYKYVTSDDILNKSKELGIKQLKDLDEYVENTKAKEKLSLLNMELEAYTFFQYALTVNQAQQELLQNFASLGQAVLIDTSKIPNDIVQDILLQDYSYKRKYDKFLFNEDKKKNSVNSIDLLTYLIKLYRESSLNTFSNPHIQRAIFKLHRYLKINLSSYTSNCLLNNLEVPSKNDENAVFVSEGSIIINGIYIPRDNQFKFIYILGPMNKSKLITSDLTKEEIDKIILNEDKNCLYGNFFMNADLLCDVNKKVLDLKRKMTESDKCSVSVKERNYKYHIEEFIQLIEQIAKIFFEKDPNAQNKKQNNDGQEEPQDYLDKYAVFVPKLTQDSINFLSEIFSLKGLSLINFNYLALLRYFHGVKYK